ncbi:U3 small nucleolar RNA-associated protein 14 homolog A isoform X2 [Hemibagrus wyckioides]|uniref:U3 small nucleolar RNA-associated protein 14 homolog A isoform X2 n=1 Tax=Hemibagrus wyckioides TaxID=337641 RepID=UPI00266C0F91|nr:U3 small nucleolar RNA-associated protein 14 homolog A isoform X2 [Hemibagrus wyckioides]
MDSSTRKRVKMAAALVDEEEELSPDEENEISASEDEEGSDDDRKHTKLLEAISSLGGKRRRMQAERSEASVQVSEFSVNAEGAGEKIQLSDLLGSMEKTPGTANTTKKQLRNLQNSKGTLELPLSRQQTEKIQRGVAYERSSKEVSRWESVIKQNQKAEQIIFPLKQESAGPKRVEQVVAGWKAQTPLEQQIFSLLRSNNQPVTDPVLTPVEEASIKAMSLEEAKIRRAELQKARVLQSYYEAKARREKKIKSKKYHKVQKKAKHKNFLKQFDEMMKTDPAAALEELKKMELSRMEERMSLKHQNSSKWAKTKAIMAKYDDSARKAMQQQLELNKELTQKLVVPSDDDDEGKDDEEEASALPDFVNDPESASGAMNPWMRGRLTAEGHEVTTDPHTMSTEEPARSQEEVEEEEEDEEEQLLVHFETKRKLRQDEEDDLVPVTQEEEEDDGEKTARDGQEEEEEEEEEQEVVSEFNTLFNRLMKNSRTSMEPPPPPGKPARTEEVELEQEEEALLDEGLVRARTMEDLEGLVHDGIAEESVASVPHAASVDAASEPHSRRKKEIDPREVLTKDANVIKVPLAPTLLEGEEEEGSSAQMSIIKEAFAGDDVISDFLKDKKKQEEAGQPKVVDLTLPGWGEWGGVGLKPSRYKRRKFRLKPHPAALRKDQKLPAVIISEKRNSSVALHQVSQLPFPFQNSSQFEVCMRSPVGQTWNTQNSVKKLTAPKVVTRLGSIIEPLRKEDFQPEEKSAEALKKRPQIVLEEKRGKGGRAGGGARRAQRQQQQQKKKKQKTD